MPSEKLVKNSLDSKADTSSLSSVATSGSYNDLSNKPTIPTASTSTPSADTSSGSYGSGTSYARSNHTHPKSSLYAEATHNHTKSEITDFPTIPSKISDLTNDSDFIEKSSTTGLVKNDGTIDTTTYLSQMKVGSSANYLIYTTSNGVLASKQKLGNINYLGRIGSTSGLPLKTGTNGVIETGSFGTSSGTFAEGNHTHSEYVNPTIVDNLTTDDATKVLSAKQGKVLNDLIGTAIQYINQ